MSKFGDIRQNDMILMSGSDTGFVKSVAVLPALPVDDSDADFHMSDGVFMVTEACKGFMPGTYVIRRWTGTEYTWAVVKDTTVHGAAHVQINNLGFLINVPALALTWTLVDENPTSTDTWMYDVVVRKPGIGAESAPSDPNDGEIVGYSSIKNQYSSMFDETKFVCLYDENTRFEHYVYRIFSVFRSGKFVASDPIPILLDTPPESEEI